MSLMERAKHILVQPKTEWPVIEAEQTTTGKLYTNYIIPLAAIGPVATAIGWSLFGYGFGGLFGIAFAAALKYGVAIYLLSLAGVFGLAWIIDALAPTFGAQKNQIQALKVAAYSYTAAWVGGIFFLFPSIALLVLLPVLYSCYLLFLGLPVLMKAPEDRLPGYTMVVILAAFILWWLEMTVARRVMSG
jgi:hypothetical protein